MDFFSGGKIRFQGGVSKSFLLCSFALKPVKNLHTSALVPLASAWYRGILSQHSGFAILCVFHFVQAAKQFGSVLLGTFKFASKSQLRDFVRGGFVQLKLRYRFATSRIQFNCRSANKWHQFAAFGCPTSHCVLRGCARRYD